MAKYTPLTRLEMAARVARDIPEGWFVNLGFGMPVAVADQVPKDREVLFHSEQGVVGMGPKPGGPGEINPWLVNAAKQYVTLQRGGSYVHHADSFAMIRGGHIDLCVLGAYQVAPNGDFANWSTSDDDIAPSVGGAMDLSVGSKRIWVLMDHTTRAGEPKLVNACDYPLTALGAVNRIYTNLAVIDVRTHGFVVIDMIPGMTIEELRELSEAPLAIADSDYADRSMQPKQSRANALRDLTDPSPASTG